MSENVFNLGDIIAEAKKVITNPIGFYQNMPAEGGYPKPLIFVVVMSAITGLLITIFAVLGLNAGTMAAGGMAMGALIMMPIMGVIGSFIGAAIMFVIWKLMGSDKNFETAYRCVAYATVTMPVMTLLAIIPYVATVIRTLWGAFLMYAASIGVHNIKAQTAKLVFGILAAIGVVYGLSAENTARKWADYGDRMSSNARYKNLENMEDMTPEEAGKQVGEILKDFGAFSKGLEQAVKEAEAEAEAKNQADN